MNHVPEDAWMSDMNKPVSNEVLLTSDDIRKWQGELRDWEAKKAKAESHIAELRKKLEATSLLFGASFPLSAEPELEGEEPESLTDAAKRVLGAFGKPVSHQELQAALRKTPRFAEMLDKNNGAYYYTMIRRLLKRGAIRKTGKKMRLVHTNEEPTE